jgi:hypothetical protein
VSTRSSILYEERGRVHLFTDCATDFDEEGMHLDITPDWKGKSGYGELEISGGQGGLSVHVRIPPSVVNAIADYVIRHREYLATRATALATDVPR